jgi:D-inositol-3-phosphate glycosyltransferase
MPRQALVILIRGAYAVVVTSQTSSGPEPAESRPRVIYSFPHTLGKAGIGTTAAHQVDELIAQGFDVRVFCTSSEVGLEGATSVVQTLMVGSHRVPHRVLGVQRAYQQHDRRVAAAVRRLAGKVDLVHAWPAGCQRTFEAAGRLGILSIREVPNPHTASAFAEASAAARAVGVRLPRTDPHRYKGRRLRLECAEYDIADFLLVPSDYVQQSFIARGYPAAKLIRHHYGFDPVSFPEPLALHSRAERPFTAVFAGRGEPRKGLHLALRAWLDSGIAEHGRFLICGSIIPAYRRALSPMLSHPSIDVHGFVKDVGAVMRSADVLLFPTVSEGSALVTHEAMASGCVPLVSDAAGAPTRHMVDGLVHHVGDVSSLTSQLRLLGEDRALLHRLRAGAVARRDELTWQAAGRSLQQAYDICLARQHATQAAQRDSPDLR